jgi:selT/selW/selH-like putative selenoprotein
MDPTLLDDSRTVPGALPGAHLAPDARAVRVVIEYCAPGNHEKVARSLAGALREEFPGLPVLVDLAASAGGLFEVRVNGKLVHSKRATFRFPSPDEVSYHVRAALSGSDRETASS